MELGEKAAERAWDGENLAPLVERALGDPQPGASCTTNGRNWSLELWGTLPPGWCGNLSLHCSAAGIAIVRGTAQQVRAGRWAGRFTLDPNPTDMDLAGFDYLRMVRRRPGRAGRSEPLVLDEVRVESDPGEDLPLRVRVRARDRLGLLADLLDRFAFFGLHPERLAIDTRDGIADDCFWLCRVGGGSPSPTIARALRRSLSDDAPKRV